MTLVSSWLTSARNSKGNIVVVVVVIAQQLFSYRQLSRLRKSVTASGLSHRCFLSSRVVISTWSKLNKSSTESTWTRIVGVKTVGSCTEPQHIHESLNCHFMIKYCTPRGHGNSTCKVRLRCSTRVIIIILLIY